MNNNLLKGSLFFISGAAIASFITYKLVEKKFKDIADEEIESVKEMYERKLEKVQEEKNEVILAEKVEITTNGDFNEEGLNKASVNIVNPYGALVGDLGYTTKREEKSNVTVDENIEIIPPEDFGEYGYKCESLTYYTDDVLTFDNDEVINDISKIVGSNALNTFGEYEDDSVFVRNHELRTDYEILKEYRKYSEVVSGSSDNDLDDDE